MKPSLFALVVCLTVALGSNAFATNLVINGDFQDLRDIGFWSDYSYNKYYEGPELAEASFTVMTQASSAHTSWLGFYDHTFGTSSGRYFVANCSSDTGIVWGSTPIVVSQAHTPYRFEAWISKVFASDPSPPILTFQVGTGWTSLTDLGTTASLSGVSAGVWLHTYVDFEFESSGTYYLTLRNSNSAVVGNDLGLDDIYFGLRSDSPSFGSDAGASSPTTISPVPVPEPSTYVMALAGLVCGGVSMFRRRKRF